MIGDTRINLITDVTDDGFIVQFTDEPAQTKVIVSDSKPGDIVWRGTISGKPISMQVRYIKNGYIISYAGTAATVYVYTQREADIFAQTPKKQAADTSRFLLCPMPGLIKQVAVKEGQEVKAGEIIAVVEAMKMENVLRAEKDATVKTVKAKEGDILAVDAVIMEFA